MRRDPPRLNALRREFIDPTIAAHSGRIVKLMGDGALVEFASAVDAVNCAIEIQRKLRDHDARRSEANPSGFGSGSMSAISSSRVTTSSATASTSRLGSKASPSLAASLFPRTPGDKFRGKSRATSSMPASRASKISPNPCASIASSSAEKVCHRHPELALPDKPSMAVLPFHNMSGDPEQEFFCDGLVEDIITALSCSRLRVIARNSASFTRAVR